MQFNRQHEKYYIHSCLRVMRVNDHVANRVSPRLVKLAPFGMERNRRIDELPIIILTPYSNGKATTNAPAPSIGCACPFPHCCFKCLLKGISVETFFQWNGSNKLTLRRTKPYPVCRPDINRVIPSLLTSVLLYFID